jgi:hypothetical protein
MEPPRELQLKPNEPFRYGVNWVCFFLLKKAVRARNERARGGADRIRTQNTHLRYTSSQTKPMSLPNLGTSRFVAMCAIQSLTSYYSSVSRELDEEIWKNHQRTWHAWYECSRRMGTRALKITNCPRLLGDLLNSGTSVSQTPKEND